MIFKDKYGIIKLRNKCVEYVHEREWCEPFSFYFFTVTDIITLGAFPRKEGGDNIQHINTCFDLPFSLIAFAIWFNHLNKCKPPG